MKIYLYVFYLKTYIQQDYNNTHTLYIFLLYQAVGGKLLWPMKLICELCQKIQNLTVEVCAFY